VTASTGYAPRRVARLPSWLLANVARHGHQLVGERLAGERLRRQHYVVLAGLAELDAPAQAELGRLLRVDGSDLVAILNDLEFAGHVSRRRDPADRRRNAVSVTRRGQLALRRMDRAVEKANDDLVACLSPIERELLVSMLTRILLSAGATDPEASTTAQPARTAENIP
jgi:DNA-binding MarR family transcriptional regulator